MKGLGFFSWVMLETLHKCMFSIVIYFPLSLNLYSRPGGRGCGSSSVSPGGPLTRGAAGRSRHRRLPAGTHTGTDAALGAPGDKRGAFGCCPEAAGAARSRRPRGGCAAAPRPRSSLPALAAATAGSSPARARGVCRAPVLLGGETGDRLKYSTPGAPGRLLGAVVQVTLRLPSALAGEPRPQQQGPDPNAPTALGNPPIPTPGLWRNS